MNEYLPEFIGFATVQVLSLISPGPDFMMVLRTSFRESRRVALIVALGIACGETIHCTYSILGLGVLVKESEFLMTLLRYVGGAYLVYIGVRSVFAQREVMQDASLRELAKQRTGTSAFGAWQMGFLTNITNVKAAFFTISCFAVFVSPGTPLILKVSYSAFVVVATVIWFSIVVMCLTNSHVQQRFVGIKHWIERVCGVFLIYFGASLALSETAMHL